MISPQGFHIEITLPASTRLQTVLDTHNMQILRRPVSLIIYEEALLYYLRCTEFPSNQRHHELNYHLPRQELLR